MCNAAGDAVGGDLQLHAESRRIKGDLVAHAGGAGIDFGFAGQWAAVGVEHAQLIFLGKPPGHLFLEQGIERVRGNQGAVKFAALENRYIDFKLNRVRRAIGFRIDRLAEFAGRFNGLRDGCFTERGVFIARRSLARHRVKRSGCGIEPAYLLQFLIVFQEVPATDLEQRGLGLVLRQIECDLLELFGIAFKVETKALFQPQHVGNQR